MLIQISSLVLRHSHRPLFIPLPDVERVLEDGVHDSPDAKGRLDYVGNNLLHCGKTETVVFPHEKTHCSTPELGTPAQCRLLPCRVFWNLLTPTMSLVSLNARPAVSRLNSLQTHTHTHTHTKLIHVNVLLLT